VWPHPSRRASREVPGMRHPGRALRADRVSN
jgi:hypothetical protein